MAETLIDPVALFGTEEPVETPVILRAGSLAAELEAGNLRHIRVGSVEVIRAISFIIRDRHWGTLAPDIDDLAVETRPDGFTLRYRAQVGDGRQGFRYSARIEAREGGITFEAEGTSDGGFETTRTGFVILHPIIGVAGRPVLIEHVDGRMENGVFPDLIDPLQPMMELRALTHEPAPGLTVECRMEGDSFEMEDQRNWCDASYKTYVRPLALPWPYRLEPGETLRQSVSLSIRGRSPTSLPAGDVVSVRLGERLGPAPRLGVGFDPHEFEATKRVLTVFADFHPHHLTCHFDSRRGHDVADLRACIEIAGALGTEPCLEAVIAEVDGFEAEIETLGAEVRSLGQPFRAVLLSPAADLKSTPPGQIWPAAPPAAAFYRAARRAFPDVRLGGGMISCFTEINRKRPPLDDIDFVGFTTMALVHACDDVSVIEGLEALPSIARSALAIAQGRPIVVGPSAIGLRMNPYGAAPLLNAANKRQAMAWNDPRQRSQLGAAWTLTHYARLAYAGIEAVTYGGTTGPFGLVHTAQSWPTPGYDQEGTPYPVFEVCRVLAGFGGQPLRRLIIDAPDRVEGVAVEYEGGTKVMLTNLQRRNTRVRIAGTVVTLGPYGIHAGTV